MTLPTGFLSLVAHPPGGWEHLSEFDFSLREFGHALLLNQCGGLQTSPFADVTFHLSSLLAPAPITSQVPPSLRSACLRHTLRS